jgi:hypothetical protein
MRTQQRIDPTFVVNELTDTEQIVLLALKRLSPARVMTVVLTHFKDRPKPAPAQVEDVLTAQGDAAKPVIEARSGPSVSSAEASKRLRISDETVRARVRGMKLVGYFESDRKLRLPEWQFSTPESPHAWVAPLLAAFGENGWPLLDFLTVPRNGLVADTEIEGESLLQLLRAGRVNLVLEAAHRANPT